MNGFDAERKYYEIVSEQDEIINDLEKYTNEIVRLEKLVKLSKKRFAELVAEKKEVMQFKLPADYLR